MEITNGDLNLVDFLNGSGKLNYKGIAPDTKGAGSEYLGGSGNNEDIFSGIVKNRLLYITQQKNLFISMLCEKWEYTNLPWDKYYFESSLLEKGSIAIVSILGKITPIDYTIEETDYFNMPTKIKSISTNKELIFNENDFAIVRSNVSCESVWLKGIRYFSLMEKILYFLEDNVSAAKERGILIEGNQTFQSVNDKNTENIFNMIMSSEQTFFKLSGAEMSPANLITREDNKLFEPIELRDRTESLIHAYNAVFERVKELFGISANAMFGKKERVIQNEIESQDEIGDNNLKHFINIRKNDFEKVNSLFGTNIMVNEVVEEIEEPEIEEVEDENS